MAYNVSNKYREVIYSGDAKNTAKLTINDVSIPTSNIKKITISSPITDNSAKIFYLGNFISQQITIEFRNVNNVPIEGIVHLEIGTLVDENYEYVPIGDFIIETNPEDFYNKCKLVCLDKAVLMKNNVDFSSIVPTTIENLLQWLCTYFKVEIGTYPTTNKDMPVNVYDNTVSGKQYVSYIAELMGGNAKIGRDGKLYIIPLKNEPAVTINAKKSKSWTYTDTYEISKVTYFDAIRNATFGNDTKNTLFIRQENMFIGEEYETITENIYNSVVGTKICSLKTENYGDPSLDCWDYIKYILDDKEYVTINNNTITFEMNIASKVETKIPSKNQEVTTNVVGDDKAIIKKLQTNVNQLEGKVEIIAEESSENSSNIAQLQISASDNESKISSLVSQTTEIDTKLENNYQELSEKFDDYIPQSDFAQYTEQVSEELTNTYKKIEVDQMLSDGTVSMVKTTSGTFDADGLTIDSNDSKVKNLLAPNGMIITDKTGASDTELLFAGYDEELNETVVRSKNMYVEKYFTVAENSRIEKYETGAGIFWVGD